LYESTLLSLDGRGAGGEGESACAVVTQTALVITVVTFLAWARATTSFQSSQPTNFGTSGRRKFVGGLAPKQPNPGLAAANSPIPLANANSPIPLAKKK